MEKGFHFLQISLLVSVVFYIDKTYSFSYQCKSGGEIQIKKFCDGNSDCSDGSDEYTNTSLMSGVENCLNKENTHDPGCILPESHICNHEIECENGIDECNCSSTFDCGDGECILKVMFCDGLVGCRNQAEEEVFNRTSKQGFQCPVTRTHVRTVCVLPDQYVCDGDSECDFGIDECFCNFTDGQGKNGTYLKDVYSNDKCFRCVDGSLVIPNIHVCDGIVHCEDLSDECACPTKKGNGTGVQLELCASVCQDQDCCCPGQVQCVPREEKNGMMICLDSTRICDDKFDCMNGIDEKFCPRDPLAFNCADGSKTVKHYEVCDGVPHCPDASDESNCGEIMDHLCYDPLYRWFPELVGLPDSTVSNVMEVFKNSSEIIRFDRPLFAKKCDGVPFCTDMGDECHNECEHEPDFCQPGKNFKCPNSGSQIIGVEVCDGKPTCNDTAPELSEDELHCPNRFYCADRGKSRLPIHIPSSGKCNKIIECYDESDELDCPKETHFYCNDGGETLFVPRSQVCDNHQDCEGGSDECADCVKSPFSSDQRLIANPVLVGCLWIIGVVAVAGNSASFLHQVICLTRSEGATAAAKSNRILVLNLSAADLLVGVYLIVLGIKDALEEKYCLVDQEWKSTPACSAMGIVALIGTEVSVFTLTIMTAYRLYSVIHPFQTHKMRTIILSVTVSWLLAFALAFIPLAPTLKDYFVSYVWFRHHSFLGKVSRKQLQNFTETMVILQGKNNTLSNAVTTGYTWENMFEVNRRLNSSYVPERFFGYYSAHGVCLPRFFPSMDDDVWAYSLTLILINFFAFFFILISYFYIYRTSTQTTVRRWQSEDRASALQRKVTRIVATDLCCWMPICIMAFINLAGGNLSPEIYAFTAIILMPINSAMNPFMYTNMLDILWDKMLPIRNWCGGSALGRQVERISMRRKHSSNSRNSTTVTTRLSRKDQSTNRVRENIQQVPVEATP